MSTITRFEDLEAWRRGRELVKQVYAVTKRGDFAKDFSLKDQIRRAAVSITSNIAEGFERDGRAEFIQFLSQAKGSSGEVRSQLHHALDEVYISADEFEHLHAQCLAVSNLIGVLMHYLRQSEHRGRKYSDTIRESSPRENGRPIDPDELAHSLTHSP